MLKVTPASNWKRNGLRRNPSPFAANVAQTDSGSRGGGVSSFPGPRPPRIRNPPGREEPRHVGKPFVEETTRPGIELLLLLLPAGQNRSSGNVAHARLHLHERNAFLPRAGGL